LSKDKHTSVITNRKAKFEYFTIAEFEAGMMLTGTEVKSLRAGNAHMNDAYCTIEKGEMYLRNLHIAEYNMGTVHNHPEKRTRKLLLKKAELKKIQKRVLEKGMTVVPYKIYFNDRGFAKIQIILGQGKKTYDKRNTIKDRDNKRDLDRAKKGEY